MDRDKREGYFYDPSVRGFDSYFLLGDTADLLYDTAREAIKIGDTGLVASVSSIPQFLFGDFEFAMLMDSTVTDSNDSVRFLGLRNRGDSVRRGATYFDFGYDTTAGDSSPNTRPFALVHYDEFGNRQRKHITWDTNWSGGARQTSFRIRWERDGIDFLINDTIVGSLGDRINMVGATSQINATIPQAIRISKLGADTTDTASTALKFLNIRNAGIVDWRERL